MTLIYKIKKLNDKLINKSSQRIKKALHPKMKSVFNLNRQDFIKLFNIPAAVECLKKHDLDHAYAKLEKYYEEKIASGWPAPPFFLTDLPVNLSKLENVDIIRKADAIAEYEYFQNASKPIVNNKGEIDWCRHPKESKEWLWRLNRHQWWPVLGLAYQKTGNERYSQIFVKQMLDWVRKNPPPKWKDENSATWRLMEVGQRLRVSWIPSFALFYRSEFFNLDSKMTMLRSMVDHGRFLFLFKTGMNHLLRESNGLAYMGVCFSEYKGTRQWREEAFRRIENELSRQINSDGTHKELSTGYQWMVIDEFEATFELIHKNQLDLPKENLAEWLEKMYNFLALIVRPNWSFPQLNDGFIFWDIGLLTKAGKLLKREDFIFVGSKGQKGVPPEKCSAGFRDAGIYVMRSDWDERARYLLFDAGPYGGYHGHEDKLSFEISAFGENFIVDPGTYTYDRKDPFRDYFISSWAHNCVLVDGCSQVRRWKKENLNPIESNNKSVFWETDLDFDYVCATYDEGFGKFCFSAPPEFQNNLIKDVIHTRQIIFVKSDYWVILDELQGDQPHNYQILFHAGPEIIAYQPKDIWVKLESKRGRGCLCIIPSNPEVSVALNKGCQMPIIGWYSENVHLKEPSFAVVFELKGHQTTNFATLHYPMPDDEEEGVPRFTEITVKRATGIAFKIERKSGCDYILFSKNNEIKEFGPFRSSHKIAGIRTDKRGNIWKEFHSDYDFETP